jgi:hypothetical protein
LISVTKWSIRTWTLHSFNLPPSRFSSFRNHLHSHSALQFRPSGFLTLCLFVGVKNNPGTSWHLQQVYPLIYQSATNLQQALERMSRSLAELEMPRSQKDVQSTTILLLVNTKSVADKEDFTENVVQERRLLRKVASSS